jgi:hypothetical protein
MKAYWEWSCSSTHSLTSALDGGDWSASRHGRFNPSERAPGTHWIGSWVSPTAVLDAVVKRKIPSPRRESNSWTLNVQPVAQRYTDWSGGGGESLTKTILCLFGAEPTSSSLVVTQLLPGHKLKPRGLNWITRGHQKGLNMWKFSLTVTAMGWTWMVTSKRRLELRKIHNLSVVWPETSRLEIGPPFIASNTAVSKPHSVSYQRGIGIKRPEPEADYTPPSSSEIQHMKLYLHFR